MRPLEELVRPNIRALKPYSTARDEFSGGEITTWLDANENPYDNGVNRYPDPHQKLLKQKIAALKGVREEQVFIGNGSDEAIDLCYRIFCRPGVDNAVSIAPTYGMYRVAADINDVEMREVALGADFSLPADALLAAADERTRLLWLCSPNNPTGNAFPAAGIERLLREFDGMVVLDEAYIDFAAGPGFLARLGEFGNLIVLQTLSKAWGMAGLRLGLAFASEAVAGLFARVKYPYNINSLAQQAVAERLTEDIAPQVAEIRAERDRLAPQLAACPAIERVYPSDANFILVRTPDPDRMYDALISAGVIVRNRSRIPGCEGCLRITVGTPAENARMIETLFIDRDGTIIAEPADEQIDSLEKLAFVPGAISALKALTGLGFDLVLATNQDGLGTPSFPEDTFWPAHNKMLATLGGEGVAFDDQLIDRTFEADAAPTRKPRTGMFGRYTGGEYDLAASYVIGDRATDILLARNLGARGILLAPPAEGLRTLEEAGAADACALITDSWSEIAEFIRRGERRAEIRRETRETQITVRLDLDGRGDFNGQISTGLRFLDHMLAQIAHHGGVALAVDARGDLDIDEHHTMEDVAITLGEAVDRALGAKAGIARYGFALPMDDCRALALLDFGGRIDFEWDASFRRERVGDVPTEMFRHFFHSFACAARCNLQISAHGDNDHHKAEAVFKAFARALRMAVAHIPFDYTVPSSKGVL